MGNPVVLALATDVKLRHRLLRSVYLRSTRFWACIGVGAFALLVLIYLQEMELVEYSHPFVFLLLYVAFIIAVITPYNLLFRGLARAGEPRCAVHVHIDSHEVSLRGAEFDITLSIDSLRSAWLTKDWLLLSTTYPIDGLLLRRPKSSAEEAALLRLLTQGGIPLRGAWASIRKPPPLPTARVQDVEKQ